MRIGIQRLLFSRQQQSLWGELQHELLELDMSTLAARLAEALAASRLTQSGLAKRASTPRSLVTQQNVQQLLAGRNQTSKHLPAIARALDVDLAWLATGVGQHARTRREALLVGKVGAGSEIVRFDEGVVLAGIEPPSGIDAYNAAEIEGDSQYPLEDGWLIFYGAEYQGVSEQCIGKMCVAQIENGPTLLKKLKRGSRKGLWRLESWNAPPREDVRLSWAARVWDIRLR